MNLEINIDDARLQKHNKLSKPLVFGIAWRFDDTFYPDENWMDFGIVILGWWFHAAVNLAKGEKELTLPFMDGPYRVRVTVNNNEKNLTIAPDGTNIRESISFKNFCIELIDATNKIIEKLCELKIDESNVHVLKQYIEMLRPHMY
ncbi:MAG: hypothetical protein KDE51_20655 [Anaerolineales bacterium]|nr:hypothetical protein [Anaerolineales bacterium]